MQRESQSAGARGRAIPATKSAPGRGANPKTRTAIDTSSSAQDAAAKTAARVTRHRSTALTSMVLIGGAMTGYVTILFITSSRPSDQTIPSPKTQSELTSIYDQTANSFDADVGTTEWLAGILNARRDIASQCRGHVLEVSAGTARNLGFYKFGGKDGVKSLTLVDISKEMVEQGKLKWTALRLSLIHI